MEKDIQAALNEIESRVSKEHVLKASEFWKIVSEVKKDPALIERFAIQISRIDNKHFRDRAWVHFDVATGNFLLTVASVLGLAWAMLGLSLDIKPVSDIFLVLGTLVLSTALHPLAHYFAGRYGKIKFAFYFPGGILNISPALKIDYASYLKASPESRAAVHLAAPVITSIALLLLLLIAQIFHASLNSYIILFSVFVLTLSLEFLPIILMRFGVRKLAFIDFRKTDVYRAMRERKLLVSR